MNLHFFSPKLAILTVGLLVSIAHTTYADIKAATVRVDKLILEYHLAKKQLTTLKAGRDEYLKERNERQKKLTELSQKIKTIFDKLKNKAMPRNETDNLKEQRDELINEFNSIAKDLKESDADQVNVTKRKVALATGKLLDEFHVVIQQYAKENGYHWVIDTSGASSSRISPLIYARNAVDVTEDILAILNKDAPKEVEKNQLPDKDSKQ